MGKGWRLEHEIVRQFDTDPALYADNHTFMGFFDACYAHMGTGIPCESTGKTNTY